MTRRRMLFYAVPLFVAVLVLSPRTSSAASFDAFLKISDCDGPVTRGAFAKQIQITGFTSRIQGASSSSTGSGAGAGKVQLQPIQILKDLDKCSPVFFLAAATGTVIPQATITFVKTEITGKQSAFFEIKLTGVTIVSVEATGVVKTGQVDASAIQDPTSELTEGALAGVQEVVTLGFRKITLTNVNGGPSATVDNSENRAF